MNRILAISLSLALLNVAGCGQDVGSTPGETMKLRTANFKEMAAILNGIADPTSTDAALPKLESMVARQNELKTKMDAYKMSLDEIGKVIREDGREFENAAKELSSAITSARLKSGKPAELNKVLAKMDTGQMKVRSK
jgi:hypothetical protein